MAWFSKSRMEALADGIFAISMNLLVASLIFPGLIEGIGPAMSFNELLLSFIKDLIYYGIAFFILAIYWIYHHLHYYVVTRLDMVSIWLMLASLFFVALMPVSTAITAYYSQNPRADIFFELNLLAIGLFYMLHWWYATRGGRLTKKPIAPLVSCIALRKRPDCASCLCYCSHPCHCSPPVEYSLLHFRPVSRKVHDTIMSAFGFRTSIDVKRVQGSVNLVTRD